MLRCKYRTVKTNGTQCGSSDEITPAYHAVDPGHFQPIRRQLYGRAEIPPEVRFRSGQVSGEGEQEVGGDADVQFLSGVHGHLGREKNIVTGTFQVTTHTQ